MKFVTLLFLSMALLVAVSPAQQVGSTTTLPPIQVGQQVTVAVTLTIPAGATVSAIQWNTTGLPAGTTFSPGAQTVATGKTLYCNMVNGSCLVVGLNNTAFAPGANEIAKFIFTAPASNVTLNWVNALSSNPTGIAVATTVGAPLVLTLALVQDLNGDGKVDQADLDLAAKQVLGQSACGTANLNGDGVCDARDAQLLANAKT